MSEIEKRKLSYQNNIFTYCNDHKLGAEMFFSETEPFFKALFEENRKLSTLEYFDFSQRYVKFFYYYYENTCKWTINCFQKRIKEGFEYSINLLKQYPIDENFHQHIKDELKKLEYTKSVFLRVFKWFDVWYSRNNIEKYINEQWNTDYYNLLKESIELPSESQALFSHLNQK